MGTPTFASTPKLAAADVSTANVNRDGTGTIATVLSAGSAGTLVTRIVALARGATTAGVIRIWLHDGTTARLFEEILVSAITPSATQQVWSGESALVSRDTPLFLPVNWSVRASTHNAESFNVVANGGDQ